MVTTSFNDGWTVGPPIEIFAKMAPQKPPVAVTLPHDALISEERAAEHRGKGAFFPSGAYEYVKEFHAPAEWADKHVSLHFDGAYRDARVFVNTGLAAHRPNGYTPFDVDLDPFLRIGETNTVRVVVATHDDSRWYAGAGLYRNVTLQVRDQTHVRASHLHLTTPRVDDDLATVDVVFPVDNLGNRTRTLQAQVEITLQDGTVAAARTEPVTVLARSESTVRMRLFVKNPVRWSVETPHLYDVAIALIDGETQVDAATARLGIRELSLDPVHGLRINGETIKLRGACIHHDNGTLGAAAWTDAEHRKIRLLKEAGFNAVRSSHNMMSTAMLDACDELGVLVMDEAFDIWTEAKSPFDYSLAFPDWWERDIETLVLRGRSRASVAFYSIGNEIPETGSPFGAKLGRLMVDKIRSLDSDRFVTNGINGFVAVADDIMKMMAAGPPPGGWGNHSENPPAEETKKPQGGLNDAMSADSDGMNKLNRSDLVTRKTAEAFAVLDVAGMNYGDSRYGMDGQERPDRIIVGSETYPARIAPNWAQVMTLSHVIGDFTWTGWDYLGEVGIGRPRYDTESLGDPTPFPWLTAWCGDLDITGFRRPQSYYREIVFGLRTDPYIAVRNPQTRGRKQFEGAWAWSDSQGSWTWDAPAGTPIEVEVYAPTPEVELLVNGRSLGRLPAGPDHRFTALFDTTYEPGQITAIAWDGTTEAGRFTLATASGARTLTVRPESATITQGPGSLVYVPIEITDTTGTIDTTAEPEITVSVTGPGELLALGSGRPDNTRRYDDPSHPAFRGRVLAIIRPTGPGTIDITATADGLAPATATAEVTG